MSSPSKTQPYAQQPLVDFAPRRIRATFLLLTATMVISALPSGVPLLSQIRTTFSPVLNRVGLWQGDWSMFAPNPVINNGWLSATIDSADEMTAASPQWESPHWSRAGLVEKFVQFRHMNYYNRLPQIWNVAATQDLVDWIARQHGVPSEKVHLYRNMFRMQLPEDGTLPPRDEVLWQFVSEPWAVRRVEP